MLCVFVYIIFSELQYDIIFCMKINEIVNEIEKFAPLETQEKWDCSGFQISYGQDFDIKKILLCLSVTQDIVGQASAKGCDLIISHHPLFFIPFSFNKNIPIYSAHTNLDKANGGTTDTLIELLGFSEAQKISDFLRLVNFEKEISLIEIINLIKEKLNFIPIRVVNNLNKQYIRKIAFCAGSGADFLSEAEAFGADVFVTGDVKFHTALDSSVIIIDVGHFESEYPILDTLKDLLVKLGVEVIKANEKSPFVIY